MAGSLKKYNELYIEAIKLFNEDKSVDFKEILKILGLPGFERRLEKGIASVVDDQETILQWIDANKVELQNGLLQ